MAKKLASEACVKNESAAESFELIELATLDIELLAKAFDVIADASELPTCTFHAPKAEEEKVLLN